MSDVSKRIANLSPQKSKLLEKLLNQRDVPPILRIEKPDSLPLSFAQERLWFINQLDPDSPAYNCVRSFHLKGVLNPGALEKSFNAMICRHELLRTTFADADGQPLQVIAPSMALTLPELDLRGLPESRRQAEMQRLISREGRRPFLLRQGPLIRALLLRLRDDEQVLFVATHHIVADNWSFTLFMRELSELYDAFCNDRPSPLPDLLIQYSDFALWQRGWLQGEVLDRQLAYWREQLGEDIPLLQLPTDRPRPPVQTFRGARQQLILSESLTTALKTLSQRHQATLFMTLLAAYKILLARHTGQDDIIVGTPSANRNRVEIEGLIGYFANTLVLRTKLSGDPDFIELLGRVREVSVGAYAHQDLPFEKLVDELRPERDRSRNPLFQAAFALQNARKSGLQLAGLITRPLPTDSQASQFDLSLEVTENQQQLRLSFTYNTDLFNPSTIGRMILHMQRLLESIVSNPRQRVSKLPLLSPHESQQLLRDWNDTALEFSEAECLGELIERQVIASPDRVALVYEGEHVSYAALNARANQLAHYLRKRGAGAEKLVGVCVERTVGMVVGLLGILKSGAGYVPLDPAYPVERLSYMLDDAGVRMLLSEEGIVEKLGEHRVEVICLDREWEEIARESECKVDHEVDGENVAYVIYTSGSTGKPKGVMIEHRSLTAFLHWAGDLFASHELGALLASTSICFDLSVFELFAPLSRGGKVILAGNALQLPTLPASNEVTLINTVPSAMAELVRAGSVPESVRTVALAGEALQSKLVQDIYALGHVERVINLYGPSEHTIYSTFEVLKKDQAVTPPIGRPVANTEVYILDHHMQIVPVGVPGELYTAGKGLARGYLKRAELTAEKFMPNGFGEAAGGRLYKTGDLARYLPEGQIEFLGRIDQQIKLRGYRIELGEIEAALSTHGGVRECAVIAREDEPGEKRLVAYIVEKEEGAASWAEIRSYLKAKLPDYMVPQGLVRMKQMPLTANGKVDRRSLPAEGRGRQELESAYMSPRNDVEQRLANIWSEVLGRQQVGIHDNFFQLGGDSIRSLQIVAKANRAGLKLIPSQMFEHQTIATLAAAAGTAPAVCAEQGIVSGQVPLTPIQQQFFERDLPEPHHYNQAVMLEATEVLDAALLEAAVQHLLVHHDALRMRYRREPSGWQQINLGEEANQVFRRVDLSNMTGGEQSAHIAGRAAEAQASLRLSEGPLVRVVLFDLGSDQAARLLMVIHHLVVDGVSWRIILEDLQTAYAQLRRGEAIVLPDKTTSFSQWATQLEAIGRSKALESELSYWLADSRREIRSLPIDHAEGDNTKATARTITLSMDEEETLALVRDIPKVCQTQINDVLLAGLAQTLAQWSGESHVVLDLEGHGREELSPGLDLSRTVGWFTSLFPVELRIEAGSSEGETLKSIQEQLQHLPRRGIGYGLLLYMCEDPEVKAQLRSLPQATVSFNYLGEFDQAFGKGALFNLAREPVGSMHSRLGSRSHLLQVNVMITGRRLKVSWTYGEQVYRQATIERLAQGYLQALRRFIEYGRVAEGRRYTPSDGSEFKYTQKDLDEITRAINQSLK